MTIEVVNTTTQTDHVCTCAEACDVHRAQRWIKALREGGYPETDLLDTYLLLCQQARMSAAAGNTIDLYQGALTALVKRAGGMVLIEAEEMIPDGQILNPDVDKATEAVILKLSSANEIVAEAKAALDKPPVLAKLRS
jgi:hypothetical protein